MSRTNPFKKKRRQAKRTLLIVGEGLGEEVFLKHLRGLYSRDSGTSVTISKGRGGTADGIVIDADRVPGDYSKKIVMLDNDKAKAEMEKARQEAQKRSIELIENTPCLEFMLLTILGKNSNGKNSVWCKSEFESNYINKKNRGELAKYSNIFPKELLDKQRLKVCELNKLISIMENG
ncbi:MAG: hypothetical protein PHU42_02815 [Patescibacteria group bacterium]|nr:hypothetical protein [Patescibacteria group bacterium]